MASASPATTAKLRALYRALLRELPPRPVLASPRAPLHQRLRDSFAATAQSESASASASASTGATTTTTATSSSSATTTGADPKEIARAEQYLAYLRAQRMYSTLLERYNPGMDVSEEERVRLSARRVGLDMPDEVERH
jgi:ATP synthase assembly factor FMC1